MRLLLITAISSSLLLLVLLPCAYAAAGLLSTGIHKHPDLDTWFLVTERSTYVVGATDDGYLLNLHWGDRLNELDNDLNATRIFTTTTFNPPITYAQEELPAFGGLRYRELALKVELPNGVRELNLLYSGRANMTGDSLLDLELEAGNYTGLTVTLHYELDVDNDIVCRSYTIRNGLKKGNVNLSKALSAAWHPPSAMGLDEERELLTLSGDWAHEAITQRTRLRPGVSHTVQSPRGFPSHQSYPYFALRQVPTGETSPGTSNEVYFGALAWSGSWEITVDTTIYGYSRITGGIHHQDFGWTLEPGESFTTPVFAAGYTNEGLPGARKRMPRHVRKYQLKNVKTQQKKEDMYNPVLYNSWEALTFNITYDKQIALADKAAAMGIELFAVDDGWFGARDNDSAGLGDWFVNKRKFPHGMKPLADHVHNLGMKFGLWFEPESFNPNSDLYRKHPDWAFYYDGIPRYEARNQLLMNLGLPEVREYLYNRISTLVKEIGIDFIKWDMNRPFAEVTMHNYKDRNPREAWVLAVEGFYSIIDKLKQEFPDLMIETCASGGGRMDIGILQKVDQAWTSDNTRPDARLFIQYGASMFLPPRIMYGWVTDSPYDSQIEIPLSFRFHVSFMGGLGVGSNLNNMEEGDIKEAAGWIELYKQIRHVIQNGDLDWLVQPSRVGDLVAVSQTTSQDRSEAVVLAYRFNSIFSDQLNPLRLRYLDPKHTYRVRVYQDDPSTPSDEYEMSGALLLSRGIVLPGLNNIMFRSAVVWVQQK